MIFENHYLIHDPGHHTDLHIVDETSRSTIGHFMTGEEKGQWFFTRHPYATVLSVNEKLFHRLFPDREMIRTRLDGMFEVKLDEAELVYIRMLTR